MQGEQLSACGSTDRASDYGSEGWGFESLQARDSPLRCEPLEGTFFWQQPFCLRNRWLPGFPAGSAALNSGSAVHRGSANLRPFDRGGAKKTQGFPAFSGHQVLTLESAHDTSLFLLVHVGLCARAKVLILSGVASARGSMDRASDYGSEGWGFESLRARRPLLVRPTGEGLSHALVFEVLVQLLNVFR